MFEFAIAQFYFSGLSCDTPPEEEHKKSKIFKEKLHLVKVKMFGPGMTDGWKLAEPVCFIPIKKL